MLVVPYLLYTIADIVLHDVQILSVFLAESLIVKLESGGLS